MPFQSSLERLPRAVVVEETLKLLDGQTLSGIFNLPIGWPETVAE
jgi:hypothetical protein